jgi:Uma2 family endonuclease
LSSWKVWEDGVAPSFALEIMSEIDDLKDVAHAPQRHDELGTQELVVFDPYVEAGLGRRRFRVHRRNRKGRLGVVEETNRAWVESRVLGCVLRCVGEGERVGKSSRIALRGSVAQQTDVVVPRAS